MLGPLAAENQAGAFLLADLNVVEVGLPLFIVHRGTHIDGFVQAGADLDSLGRIHQSFQQRVFRRRVGDHSRGRRAALPGGTEGAAVNGDGGLVEIGVGHHDHRVLSAHLASHFGAALGRFGVERAADFVGTGKRDCPQHR